MSLWGSEVFDIPPNAFVLLKDQRENLGRVDGFKVLLGLVGGDECGLTRLGSSSKNRLDDFLRMNRLTFTAQIVQEKNLGLERLLFEELSPSVVVVAVVESLDELSCGRGVARNSGFDQVFEEKGEKHRLTNTNSAAEEET